MCWKAAGLSMNSAAIRRSLRLALCAGLLLLFGAGGSRLFAQSGGNDPRPMSDIRDRLAPPPISDPPTLVQLGHTEYYLYCMVCHGDEGQGLTEEWRNAGDPADANCWQSRCHASNHPPEGFVLPRYAPPLIGEYALARFATIGELYGYIEASMPWHMPGMLDGEQYRRIAVFLADANGVADLNGERQWEEMALLAPSVHRAAAQPTPEPAPPADRNLHQRWTGLFLLLALSAVVYGITWRYRRRSGRTTHT